MSTTIDSLNFDFTASNVNIDGKVDAIIEMMGKLSSSLSKISPTKINNISNGFKSLASGLSSLANVNSGGLSYVVKSVSKLGETEGLKRTASAIKDVSNNLQEIGHKDVANVSIDKNVSSLQKAKEQTEILARAMARYRDTGRSWNFNGTIEQGNRAIAVMQNLRDKIQSAYKERVTGQGIFDTSYIDKYANNYNLVNNMISTVRQSLREMSKDADDFASSFDVVAAKAEVAQNNVNKFRDILQNSFNKFANVGNDWIPPEDIEKRKYALDRMTAALQYVTDKIREMSSQENVNPQKIERFAEAYAQLKNQIAKIDFSTDEIDSVFESVKKMGEAADEQLRNTNKTLENLRDVMEGLNFEPTSLKNGEKYTAEYKKVVSQINSTIKSLERLDETQRKMAHFGEDSGKSWEKTQYSIDRAREKATAYINEAKKLEDAGLDKTAAKSAKGTSAITKIFSALSNAAKKLLSVLARVGVKIAEIGAKGVRAFARITASILSGTVKALGRLGSAIKSVFVKFSDLSGITKMFKNSDGIFAKLAKGLRKIATLTVFMALRSTIRNTMNAAREGIDNIVQVSERANAAMSSFATNVLYLKNAFASIAAPIMSIVAPALEYLTNVLARAASSVAAFFAAIGGQSTFTKAKRVQVDYAASLNNSASAANKLHKQLAGFDDLNNLTTSQGNDIASPLPADMFEEVEVPDNIKKLADKIKNILKSDDWSEIGSMLAKKLNQAMANIPWDKIEKEAQRIAKGIGTLINGFVNDLDWNLLGETIAKGINTAVHFANTLMETIDFHKIGESLGTALKGVINELDFDAIGRFFANKTNMLIDTVHGFLVEMEDEWYHFGSRIGEAVDAYFDQIHLDYAFENIALGLNGIAELVIGFVDTWLEQSKVWGGKIGSAMANMFTMIHWDRIGEAIDKGLQLIINICLGFLDAMEGTWDLIGRGIATMIDNAFNPDTWTKAGEVVNRFASGIIEALLGFLDEMKGTWAKIAVSVGNFLIEVFNPTTWGEAGNVVAGFVNGIIEFFATLFANRTLWENIGLSLGNFVNNIITGIPFQNAVQVVVNFVNGFFLALKKFNDSIEWDDVAKNISQGINRLIYGINWEENGKILGEFALNLLRTIHRVADDIDWHELGVKIGQFLKGIPWGQIFKEVAAIIWEVISGVISGLWANTEGKVLTVLGLLGLVIKGFQIYNHISTWFKPASQGIAGLLSIFGSLGGKLLTIVGGALKGVLTTVITFIGAHPAALIVAAAVAGAAFLGYEIYKHWDEIKEAAGRAWEAIKGVLSTAWEGIKSVASTAWNGITGVITGIWNGISTTASNIFGGIRDFIGGAWDAISSKTGQIWSTVTGTLSTAFHEVRTKAESAFSTIKNVATEAFSKASEAVGNIASALSQGVKDVANAAGQIASSILDGLGDIASQALEKGKDIALKLAKGITDKAHDVWNAATDLTEKVKGGIGTAVDKVGEVAGDVIDGLHNGLHNGIETVKGVATDIADKGLIQTVKDRLGSHSPSKVFEGIGNDTVDGLINGITQKSEASKGSIRALADGLLESMREKNLSGNFQSEAETMVDSFNSGVSNKQGDTDSVIREWANGLDDSFKTPDFANRASAMIDGFNRVVSQNGQVSEEFIEDWVSKFEGSLRTTEQMGKEASYRMIEGFNKHMHNNSKSSEIGVTSWAEKIKGAFQNSLQIHSPSKVFANFGDNVVQGLNKGIERMQSSTKGVVDNWIDHFASVDANINFKANLEEVKKFTPNLGGEFDVNKFMAMSNHVSLDGGEIKELVRAIELMSMQDHADMRTQNEYLQQIARKEFSINRREVFQAVQSEAAEYEMRTGNLAFGY